MDSGSARSRFTIYGQLVYLGMLHHGQLQRHIFTKLLLTLSSAIWTLTTYWRWSHILPSGCYIYWTLLRRCRYMELLFSTCYLHSSYHRTISSSDVAISNVCKYSGTRFAPINVPNSAGSVCITTFLLMTHVCHVVCYGMSCSILLHAIVYSNMS